ncbi:MAG: HPr family phosphocarrier protein [Candidatus Omnitrophota bacterium]|nr:MAG: HPr family phosphocarrier protein [Candidatus Omnitrophota bacterium]
MNQSDPVKKTLTVKNKLGLHARPAALFVQIANKYDAEISVRKGKQIVNGKSIMGIMMLAASRGSKIYITARGDDALQAIQELEKLVTSG